MEQPVNQIIPSFATGLRGPRNRKSFIENRIFCDKSDTFVNFRLFPFGFQNAVALPNTLVIPEMERLEFRRDQRLNESPEYRPQSTMTKFARHRLNHQNRRLIQVRPILEQLEARRLLAADLQLDYEQPAAAWYARVDNRSLQANALANGQQVDEWFEQFVGPRQYQTHDWIVRLSAEATRSLESIPEARSLLSQSNIDFQIVAGLGMPGMLHVRSLSRSTEEVETSLAGNSRVVTYAANDSVGGQIIPPNDSQFGNMTSLHNTGQFDATIDADIDALEAWDTTQGSPSVVVGVVDSGIDATHPDLYLNIWLNQGEIPAAKRSALIDTDSDSLFTFYDLNNAANAAQVRDLNANGYIDAIDLLDDPLWADGRDTDGNGFTDDFFGWNFRNDSNETFAPNNPSDLSGHGTHVAGTIGAIGNNTIGVTGINWRSSIMALRFLDENNQGDTASAIAAINYATMMRTQFGTNVRVLNNSWGQPGSSNVSLRNTIESSGDAGILFVAASGNGNVLGQGVDNDRTAFYPASYELESIVSVAAMDSNNRLAQFSNYGMKSVDLAAPGVGVISTLPGGGYGAANGTSMATPHVSGAALLVWSKYPSASLQEVRNAILSSVKANQSLLSSTVSKGALSASRLLTNGIYSPAVSMEPVSDVTALSTDGKQIKVRYSHRDGIDLSTIDSQDIIVNRQWGDRSTLAVLLKEAQQDSLDGSVLATYEIQGAEYRTNNVYSNSVPVEIPSDQPATITSSITINGVNDRVAALRVNLNIRHTWNSDLRATLVSPSGTQVKLFEYVGFNNDNFEATEFDDRSETLIQNASAPFTGTFRPMQPLRDLTDEPIDGTWLLVVDDVYSLDGGYLDNWTLSFADQVWLPEVIDYGSYTVSTVANQVTSQSADSALRVPIQVRELGSFKVKIEDPSYIYVDTFRDGDVGTSLRRAIAEANAARPSPRTILLDRGTYQLEQAVNSGSFGQFLSPDPASFCNDPGTPPTYSNEATGDLDIIGDVTIIGDSYSLTSIDAQNLDRVFKVHPNAKLNLKRVAISNGIASAGQAGGGILSAGSLILDQTIVSNNRALGTANNPIRGGGIAAWGGDIALIRSQVTGNIANYGGGVFVCGSTIATIDSSTIDNNFGTGYTSYSTQNTRVMNSTFSANRDGAIYSGSRDGYTGGKGTAGKPTTSSDGRFVAFDSDAGNLLPGDTRYRNHVMLMDRLLNRVERISESASGEPGDSSGFHPSINGDGTLVAFTSAARNFISDEQEYTDDVFVKNRVSGGIERISNRNPSDNAGRSYQPAISNSGRYVAFTSTSSFEVGIVDTNERPDIFVYDHDSKWTEIVRPTINGQQVEPNGESGNPTLSADGRYVAFVSNATNLVSPALAEAKFNVYVYDRFSREIELVSNGINGVPADNDSQLPSISGDGLFIAYQSDATNLVLNDSNGKRDVFLFDVLTKTTRRISINSDGVQGNQDSQFPAMSQDGKTIVFSSYADNLFSVDFNSTSDIFFANRISGELTVAGGGNWNGTADVPAVNADGSQVFFQLDGNNFFGETSIFADRNDYQDLVGYNRTTDQRSVISYFPSSTVSVSSSTFVGNRGVATITGNVNVGNSFFGGNSVGFDLGMEARSKGYNLMSTKPELGEGFEGLGNDKVGKDIIDANGIAFIESLSNEMGFPPVHVQSIGSKGIDRGNPDLETTADQLGFARVSPDIGAVESRFGNVQGSVYIDRNLNGKRDEGELGLMAATIYLDKNKDNKMQADEPDTNTGKDLPNTQFDETGTFSLRLQNPGIGRYRVSAPDNWFVSQPPLVRIVDGTVQGDVGTMSEVSMDRTGRFVAFSSISAFGFADNFRQEDIFVYDQNNDSLERITNDAPSFQPNISQDGRYVVFTSVSDRHASIKEVNENGNISDIYLYDRVQKTTTQITRAFGDREASGFYAAALGDSRHAAVSENGQYIVFESDAPNLVADDSNNVTDVFLWEKSTSRIRRISEWFDGQGDGRSIKPSISADGSIIAFSSFAENLADFDFNRSEDVFLYHRVLNRLDSPSLKVFDSRPFYSFSPVLSADGTTLAFTTNANLLARDDLDIDFEILFYDITSFSPISFDDSTRRYSRMNIKDSSGNRLSNLGDWGRSLSENGQYIVFNSNYDLVGNDGNSKSDIFIYDRTTESVRLMSRSDEGSVGNEDSILAAISGNGQTVAFSSFSNNLVADDSNRSVDVFIKRNPFEVATIEVDLRKGENKRDVNFGLVPNFGSIQGTIFADTIRNGTLDSEDVPLSGWVVYLDQNNNGVRDTQDLVAISTTDGYYFENVPSYREYTLRVESREGWSLSGKDNTSSDSIAIFLQAGGNASGLDFGYTLDSIVGQSQSSSISGSVFNDLNFDGLIQNGEVALAGVTVFLDINGNEVRDFNEPRTVSGPTGDYSFVNLGKGSYSVRVSLENGIDQTSPRGTKFSTSTQSLTSVATLLTNPQEIVSEDLNGDGWSDLAVAFYSGNSISIRLNDKKGKFDGTPISVPLSPEGTGPIALTGGMFNSGTAVDLITANYLNGTVTILLDFNGVGFASKQTISVGATPTDIVVSDMDSDGDIDAVVANQTTNQLTLLINNGNGVFSRGASFSSGGNTPTALVTGLFNNDAFMDIAVANAGVVSPVGDSGNVAVFLGRGDGSFRPAVRYTVGVRPIHIAASDLNADGFTDLVTANYNSKTASLLLGNANGTFTVSSEQLAAGEGPIHLQLVDIERDGDTDILVSNGGGKNISILRNRLNFGESGFEPIVTFGVIVLADAQRSVFAVGDFDKSSTLDIAIVSNVGNTLTFMWNTLVSGARRIQLNDQEHVVNQNFGTRPNGVSPSMNPIDNPVAIVEDSPEQSISITGIRKGRASGPALRFSSTSNLPTLIDKSNVTFIDGSSSADLRYSFVANAHGTAILTVRAVDAGADRTFDTLDDGILERSFTVTVLPVNDAPTFSLPASRNVIALEDSGERTIAGFITNIAAGGGTYEATQTLTSSVEVVDNLGLFSARPMIDATGTLRFTPAANAVGTATVMITVMDNGDTALGGANRKIEQFVLTISPVNDAPSINIGGKQTVLVGATSQSVSGFATGFVTGGGADENPQTIADFVMSVDRPDLFSVLPTIDAAGTLRYTPSTSRTGLARVSVQVRDNGGSSNGGVDLSIVKQFDIEVAPLPDTVAPTPAISSLSSTITNVSPVDLMVDFSEVVTGFALNDLVLTNATAANLTDLGAGRFTITIVPVADGTVTVSIPAAAARDLASNNSVASVSFTRIVDRTPPTPALTSASSSVLNQLAFDLAIDFSEQVSNFTLGDLIITNGAAANFQDLGNGRFSATVTASADGATTVRIPASAGRDRANNDSLTSLVLTRTIDTRSPAVALSSTTTSLTNVSPIDLTVDFGEVVTGFALSDLVLTNATAANLIELGSGKFTIAVSPTADGVVSVSIPAAAARDLANNNSLASASFTRTVDRVAPVATITTTEVSPTNKLSFPIVISFGEAVTGFDANDLVVGNATLTNLTETTPGRYTATVNAITDGVVLVGFSAGIARDAAGNGNTAPAPLLVSVNTGAATYKPLLSTTEPAVTSNRNFSASIDFGRVVTGFVAADLELTNATATIGDLGNGRFQVNLSVIGDGNVIVRLPADRVRDVNNRPNDASDALTVRFVDTANSDFGDAPTSLQSGFTSSYPTRLVDNGAFHKRSTLFLGTSSDAESDGLPNATATGDDTNVGNDENGILFPLSNVIGVSAASTSSFIAIASGVGFLDAWIDFNRDGDWADAGEQIATKLALVSGSNSVGFTIPQTASAGITFARFRFSTVGGLGVTGPAADGEVEDHAVTLVNGASKTVSLKAADLGPHEITISNGLLVVTSGSKILWSAPASEIATLTTVSETDAKLFEVSVPGTNLPGVVRYTGAGKPIELISNRTSMDLASLSADKLFGLGVIDLRATGVHQLTVRRLDVSAINAAKSLRILMDAADTLVALSNWTSGTGRMENGAWLQPYTSGDATIEIVSATPWQNEVNSFDVDGDNGISPLDVLDLINVINLNVFPNGNLPSRGSSNSKSFFDTNGDGRADPLDVLKVINELNRTGSGEGEGEGSTKRMQEEGTMSRAMIDRAMAADLSSFIHDFESEDARRRQTRPRRAVRT